LRAVSDVVAVLVAAVIAIAAVALAGSLISDYIRSRAPSGESLSMYVVSYPSPSTFSSISSVKYDLYITCAGPNCQGYTLVSVRVQLFDRSSASLVQDTTTSVNLPLSPGTTKYSGVAYYRLPGRPTDMVVAATIVDPSGRGITMSRGVTLV